MTTPRPTMTAERVLRLAGYLYARRVVTPEELDRACGLTRKTRSRDVALLRRFGWGITWDAECSVYRIRRPVARLVSSPKPLKA